MAASYINGNTFSVDFMLWPKDISTFFWNTYILYPSQSLFRVKPGAFAKNVLISLFCTLLLIVVANYLEIGNLLYYLFYFLFHISCLTYFDYKKTLEQSQTLLGKHFTFSLKNNFITLRDNHQNQDLIIHQDEVNSIVEKDDMIIIFTKDMKYLLPKRVLNRGQIQSVLTFTL